MRSFIFVAVFIAILAFETTGYSEKSEKIVGKTAEGISFEEFKAQHEEAMAMLESGVTNLEEAVKEVGETEEVLEEAYLQLVKMQTAEAEKRSQDAEAAMKKYRKAVDKYFSTD